MGGHGHDNHHHHANPNAIQEPDETLPLRIREIDLIKYNPNLFYVSISDLPKAFDILGGT